MEIIAFRARGFDFPETSIRAVRAALERPVHVLLDCALTGDRHWVVPGRGSEVAHARVRSRRLSRLRGDVTSLDAILALHSAVDSDALLMLDIPDVGETRRLAGMLERHGVVDRTVLIAWKVRVLERMHRELPTLRLCFAFVPGDPEGYRPYLDRFLPAKAQPEPLDCLPDVPLHAVLVPSLLCTRPLIEEARARSIRVWAFTINYALTKKLMERREVDAMVTEYPRSFI